jgi:hypothetical protein
MPIVHRHFVAVLFVAGLAGLKGCGRPQATISEENADSGVEHSTVNPAIADAFRRAADQQSKKIRGTTIVMHRACRDVKPADDGDAERRWIGVDVELQALSDQFEGLDLRQIDIHDGETGASLGQVAAVQRLSDDATPADNDDPIFAGADKFRGMLVYEVPASAKTVTLYHDGEPLNADPLPLVECKVCLPQPKVVPIGIVRQPASESMYDIYLLAIQCDQWSRMQTPSRMKLRCLTDQKSEIADADRWIEINAQKQPIDSAPGDRPLYPPERWFVIEFWCPKGAVLVDFTWEAKSQPLPKDSGLDLPTTTLEALANAPRLERARHRHAD